MTVPVVMLRSAAISSTDLPELNNSKLIRFVSPFIAFRPSSVPDIVVRSTAVSFSRSVISITSCSVARDLGVMDAAVIALARENRIPILVFSIYEAGSFARVLKGEGRFTLVGDKE